MMMENTFQNKVKENRITFLVILAIFIVGTIIKLSIDHYKDSSLEESKETWAIITQEIQCGKGCLVRYKFLNDKNQFIHSKYGGSVLQECNKTLKVGDTILIRYSLSNPEITELVHCFWNDRLREKLKKNN